jgi:ABC-type transport system involved in cytochrome bd biosynthesis fused ATPase/permease subunit
MQNVRRIILALSSLIGVWLFVSFGGAMFDTANAVFWTNSLMWALLSCLIVMPALLMVSLASSKNEKKIAEQKAAQQKAAQETSSSKQEPFIQEESEEARTLWPEPDQNANWPAEQSKRDHVRA